MRLFALTLALLGALTAASAQASVLTSRNLTQGAALLNAAPGDLLILPSVSLFGFEIAEGQFSAFGLNLDALGSPVGTPLTATDFDLSLTSSVDFYFGSGVEADNSTFGRLELLFETDQATGGFATATQFLLVVVTGGFDNGLSPSADVAGPGQISIFTTSPVAAIPLPASLPLLLGGLAAFGLLRRRARAA